MSAEADSVVVLGAGMVGVSCALELQRRGLRVTLVDREAPGSQTSYGNAGVIARSSLIPFNNPALWRALPRLARNRAAGFRYRPAYLLANLRWAAGFLAGARRNPFEETARALDALIVLSMSEHRRLMQEAGVAHRLREDGWLFLYRGSQGFDAAAPARRVYDEFGVRTETLTAPQLHDLEPHLRPLFAKALWVRDAWSVDSPGDVVSAYAQLFGVRGGCLLRDDVIHLGRRGEAWALTGRSGRTIAARRVVVALGPWARPFLAALKIALPLALERGYHMHYGSADGGVLGRPVYDTVGGYVMSPMARGIRVTTGVELAGLDDAPNLAQLEAAERGAREAFPLAARLDETPWLGSRPTLPDCRPMIGAVPGEPGLWLALGHQHIGFSTGPGTASVLGALMAGEAPRIDAAPFRAERYLA